MKPITRKEMLMAKAAGQDAPDITPVTREEIFLAKAAGMDVPELEPVTRNEWFISQISGGGGGGGDSDFSIASVTFVNTYSGRVNLGGPVVLEENEMGEGAPAMAYDLFRMMIMPNETVTRKIPLYKGSALIDFDEQTFTCATTGDIEEVGPGMLLVTGSGTMTLTYVGD